jgi:Transposase DNA-binding/Transposase Tn5 dimerisation domain/Transposase DDE domain
VRSLVDAGRQSAEWVRHEFAGIKLGDERLDRRLIKTAELLAKSPLSPINEACGCWADTQAAYRLFDNVKAAPSQILEPHVEATVNRIAKTSGLVLVIQDTVLFDYTKHPKTRGLGLISDRGERGLVMHNAMAFTTSGLPLGLLSQNTWARPDVPKVEESVTRMVKRLARTPIEEKESFKWLRAMNEVLEHCPSRAKLIMVADRESDIFEVLTEAKQQRTHFIIRARCDRRLMPEDNEGYESIVEALNGAKALGTMTVDIPSNGKRRARTAQVEVRATQITINPPDRRRSGIAGREWALLDPLSVKVVGASERNVPPGEEAISWVLLTDLPALDLDSAIEKVNWYSKRFGIEIWHKVLKSGCKVENCLLETVERLTRYLTVFSVIGVRLMYVCHLARLQPDMPSTEVFSEEEIEALHVRVNHTLLPRDPPSLREVIRMIGSLGGHLGRKCDGEPGVTVLWRGWMRLYEDVIVLGAHKKALGLVNTS